MHVLRILISYKRSDQFFGYDMIRFMDWVLFLWDFDVIMGNPIYSRKDGYPDI